MGLHYGRRMKSLHFPVSLSGQLGQVKTSLLMHFYKYLLVGITILKGHKHLLQQLVSVLLIKETHLD